MYRIHKLSCYSRLVLVSITYIVKSTMEHPFHTCEKKSPHSAVGETVKVLN